MKVMEVSLFKSADLKTMSKDSFKNGDAQIDKTVPPMIADEKAAENIDGATDTAGSVTNSVSTGNFVLSLVLGGSMQQLWGMIRALQMIVLSALIRVPLPAHCFMFFQGCMMFAQMDILDGQGFYKKWFKFRETTPHSEMFEMMDIGDKNFMMNSGSYFILFALAVGYSFGRYLLNSMARCCPTSVRCRKLGIYAYEASYTGNLWTSTVKLFIESFFDLTMCAMLANLSFLEIPKGASFASLFSNRDDAISSTLSLLYTLLVLVAPVIGYFSIKRNLGNLDSKVMIAKYGVFYQENRTDTSERALYNIYFLGRRFFTVLVLVFLT